MQYNLHLTTTNEHENLIQRKNTTNNHIKHPNGSEREKNSLFKNLLIFAIMADNDNNNKQTTTTTMTAWSNYTHNLSSHTGEREEKKKKIQTKFRCLDISWTKCKWYDMKVKRTFILWTELYQNQKPKMHVNKKVDVRVSHFQNETTIIRPSSIWILHHDRKYIIKYKRQDEVSWELCEWIFAKNWTKTKKRNGGLAFCALAQPTKQPNN